MNVPFYIAKRHLFAKKKQNAVNIITRISVFVITIVTAAMLLILSAFNGIESLVLSFSSSIEPDLTIEPIKGKSFSIYWVDSLADAFPENEYYPIFKEDAIIRYDGNQTVATLYGVSNEYLIAKQFQTLILDGEFVEHDFVGAFLGLGIKYQLQVPKTALAYRPIGILVPKKGKKISKQKEQALTTIPLNVNGVFSINAEYDTKYLFVPYHKIAVATGNEQLVTQIAVLSNENPETVKQQLSSFISSELKVATRSEKNKLVYETSKSEKWFTFAILLFICCIAAFNIIASVAMLIIDKRQELLTFQSIGMTTKDIARIFLLEGMLINGIGILLGLSLGLFICFLQERFGLVPLEGATIEFYPVLVKASDLIMVASSVFIIGILFTYLPVHFFRKKI